jgi:branched-chain amino acid transport system permease protein
VTVIINVIQNLVDAISVGSLYALTALGIGLIFGVMRLINFAHSELLTLTGYTLLLLNSEPTAVAIIGGVVVAIAIALATERVVFRPLRGADPTTLLIASFALSFFIQKTLALTVGSKTKGIDVLPQLGAQIVIGGVRFQLLKVVTIVVTIVLLGLLSWFLKRTRYGRQMRAAAENFRMAQLLGVRANLVISLAFAISGILAAAVGILFVSQSGFLEPRMGLQLVAIAFVGTVIGGLGSLTGAAVGGFLVGAATVLLQAVLPLGLREFRELFVYLLVVVILLVRPQGLIPAPGLRQRV